MSDLVTKVVYYLRDGKVIGGPYLPCAYSWTLVSAAFREAY